LLSSVLLEWCSSGLPPNLVKRELASTPTLSLDYLTMFTAPPVSVIASTFLGPSLVWTVMAATATRDFTETRFAWSR
jgi:hypothetical protein